MRISDWSSDVCAAQAAVPRSWKAAAGTDQGHVPRPAHLEHGAVLPRHAAVGDPLLHACRELRERVPVAGAGAAGAASRRALERVDVRDRHPGRSEEHTSELQSLMRISYA